MARHLCNATCVLHSSATAATDDAKQTLLCRSAECLSMFLYRLGVSALAIRKTCRWGYVGRQRGVACKQLDILNYVLNAMRAVKADGERVELRDILDILLYRATRYQQSTNLREHRREDNRCLGCYLTAYLGCNLCIANIGNALDKEDVDSVLM